MTRPIVTMSPSQLLALKSLDPPHDEEQHGEHEDGQPDIGQVLHDASFGRAERSTPLDSARIYSARIYRLSKQRSERSIPPANDVHASRWQSLTKFMRKLWADLTSGAEFPGLCAGTSLMSRSARQSRS